MWLPSISQSGFRSVTDAAREEDCTGKWLVPVPLGDPDWLWERIAVTAASGRLPCAKLSAPRLDAILGHHLACVYSPSSRREDVAAVLAALRGLGADGDLVYKTDLATVEGRDDAFATSRDIEPRPPVTGAA